MPETFPKRSRDKVWKVKAAPKDANPPVRPSQDKIGEGNEETDKFIRSMEDEGMKEDDEREVEASRCQPCEEKVEEGSGGEEAKSQEKLKKVKVVKGPSREEWERHRLTHGQYREWCKACVQGRAVGRTHHEQLDREEG